MLLADLPVDLACLRGGEFDLTLCGSFGHMKISEWPSFVSWRGFLVEDFCGVVKEVRVVSPSSPGIVLGGSTNNLENEVFLGSFLPLQDGPSQQAFFSQRTQKLVETNEGGL